MSIPFPLLGLFSGFMYVFLGFSGRTNDPPTLAITFGPFQEGSLILGGYHVHHWCIYGPLTLMATTSNYYNVAAFCFVMTLQGLSYPDRFQFTPRSEHFLKK